MIIRGYFGHSLKIWFAGNWSVVTSQGTVEGAQKGMAAVELSGDSAFPFAIYLILTYITLSIILINRSPERRPFLEVSKLIKSFFDRGTEDIFNRVISREARATCPREIWTVARRKLDQLNAVVSLHSLRIPPGNKLEALKGDRRGQHSIRINDQLRVCFTWTPDGPEHVEITDYH